MVLTLPLDGRYMISGAPGTGKTVVALYRASRMMKAQYSVRILMYSNLLTKYTKAASSDAEPVAHEISTYHSWFPPIYRAKSGRKRVPVIGGDRYKFDWLQIIQDLNPCAPDSTGEHLLIDEGQDLSAKLYMIIRQFISTNITVFADENQRIMSEQCTLREIYTAADIPVTNRHFLTRNYRNTLQIHQLAIWFHRGSPSGLAKAPVREGIRPAFVTAPDIQRQAAYIHNYERLNSDLSIGVLVYSVRDLNRMIHLLKEAGCVRPVHAYNSQQQLMPEFKGPGITVLCYPSAKGLEFDTVFIPGLERLDQTGVEQADEMMRMYVMVTRARNELFLMHAGASCALSDALPDTLIRRIELEHD